MKQLIWFGVVLAIALSVIPAAPATAQVQPIEDRLHALLINGASGLCVQPEYYAAINGLAIVQQPCIYYYNPYQRWYLDQTRIEYHPNVYQIVNSGTGQCLDDRDGKSADGSPVQQWPCNSTSTTMQWKKENVGQYPFNYDQYRNIRTGKCLDVRGGSGEPGAVLQIYRCTSTATSPNWAQLFRRTTI
jgi:hypothetical protein